MPIDLGLWRIGGDDTFHRVSSTNLDSEDRLERFLLQDPNVLGQPLLVIDRQITTPSGKRLDILAIDEGGDLHVVELKRDRSPRDVTAQILDYASWVRRLDYQAVKDLYEASDEHTNTFEAGFGSAFYPARDDAPTGPEEVNNQHKLTIVSSELDSSTERIIEYLSEEFEVPINAIRFNYYMEEGREYIARTWLKDPYESEETEEEAIQEPWNGYDFYANFGQNEYRKWEDAREYGFITGGHGEWYHRTMEKVAEGKRIFVYNPGEGYIGVGIVTQEKTPAPEFMVSVEGEEDEIPITEAPLKGDLSRDEEDPDLREYLIGVEWEKTLDVENAFWEKGLYANQNTVTRLQDQQTLDRLYEVFDVAAP
ncbi:PDDEXK family nuclease [Halococcus sediminicola]|uniref:endonuclease NucS domain-containing protein n=1 Tax=Halococcus sediminicola TaxID=1264579 RepID=UPI0009ADB46A|nr:endonuclease NucS domain-containing protein [Halococcus sediminicola]